MPDMQAHGCIRSVRSHSQKFVFLVIFYYFSYPDNKKAYIEFIRSKHFYLHQTLCKPLKMFKWRLLNQMAFTKYKTIELTGLGRFSGH